jgi:amidase
MNRREFLGTASLAASHVLFAGCVTQRGQDHVLEESTVADLQRLLASGRQSAESLTRYFLRRIEDLDRNGPKLNSVIELNPDALIVARRLDDERKQRGPRGPLHGIPLLLKDNIDSHDRMTTTAGSLALEGSIAPRDATVTAKLRDAGAVILGKTNLSEWANFRGHRSTSGWSARGGLTRNPYVLDRDPSGSSTGSAVAVAANLCAVAIGTETDGSIVSPAGHCGVVGFKPTVGLISRAGIIPISESQDTAGPITRTVADAAALLGAMTCIDDRDPATERSRGRTHRDYTQFLDADGLRGARIGVARKFFDRASRANQVFESALEVMKRAGGTLVDPADLPTHGKFSADEFEIFLYEFKAGVNAYLATLSPKVEVRTLDDVIAFNERHRERELPFFGQELLIASNKKGPLTEGRYLDARDRARRLAGAEGIDAVMNEHRLDAIVAPTAGPACRVDFVYGDRGEGASSSPAAVAGYPNISVPAGYVYGLPVGISFFGRAWSEPVLLKLAYAFERHSRARQQPRYRPSVTWSEFPLSAQRL